MILNNKTKDKVLFKITSANGRGISEDVNASTSQNVDLSKYLSPFNIEVEISGNIVDTMSGVGEGQSVEIFYSGYGHSVT